MREETLLMFITHHPYGFVSHCLCLSRASHGFGCEKGQSVSMSDAPVVNDESVVNGAAAAAEPQPVEGEASS